MVTVGFRCESEEVEWEDKACIRPMRRLIVARFERFHVFLLGRRPCWKLEFGGVIIRMLKNVLGRFESIWLFDHYPQ